VEPSTQDQAPVPISSGAVEKTSPVERLRKTSFVFFEHWYHRNITIENIIEISYFYWISMIFLWYFYESPWKNPLLFFELVIFANKTSGRPSNPRARSQQLGGGQVLLLEGSTRT
jgi:hypothetical protein